jgi:hypothetical protein
MKALLIVLLLAGMAWGGEYADTPHCSNSWGDCESPIITSTSPIYEDITDTATATFLSIVNYEAGHTMEFNIETGEVTIDDKPIAEFSHPDLKILLKKIGEQLYESNQLWKRQCDFQTGMLLKALEKCEGQPMD